MEKVQTEKMDTLSKNLEEFYPMMNNDEVLEKAVAIMHHELVKKMVEVFLKDSENENFMEELHEDPKVEKSYLRLLKTILKIANFIYNYSGESTGISDAEYDELLEFYKEASGDDSIITEAKDDPNSVHHKYKTLRGTLDKIYKITEEDVLKNKSQKSLDDWVKKTEKRYEEMTGKKIDLYEEEVMVFPKFDGVSTVFECNGNTGKMERALTRGNTKTNEAQDVTHIFDGFYQGPFKGKKYNYGEKVEVMMLDSSLEEYNKTYKKDYKNTRSIVSSILNSNEADERVRYLQIIPLRVSWMKNGRESLQEISPGVFHYPYLKCQLKEREKIRNFALAHKTVHPGLRCDGAVIQLTNPEVQRVLGRENEKQKYEVAFKFTEETGYSKVVDIEFTIGLFGRLNPVVVFKPLKLKGNTVCRASLGSYARFKSLNLAKGDVIKVLYDIIPYAQFDPNDYHCIRSGKDAISAPETCPDCGNPLEESETGDILRCTNKKCPSCQKGKILNYCRKMDIANISYATVEDLYREGYLRKIPDLYTLESHKKEIVDTMDGYSDKKLDNIINEINTHKEATASLLFGSIGIESLSTKKFKNIFEHISIGELLRCAEEADRQTLMLIPNIKSKLARKIIEGVNDNRDVIDFLLEEFTLKPELTGNFTVVFSMVRDPEAEQFIIDSGGIVQEQMTRKIDLLVVPNLSVNSTKTRKAHRFKIPVVTVDQVIPYVKKHFL